MSMAPAGAMTLAEQELVALEELEQLKAKLTAIRGKGVSVYYDDPVGFIRDCVKFRPMKDGTPGGLAPYQAEIIGDLPRRKRIAVRGPRGLGKSTTASLVVLWFAITREAAGVDWKIATTAGSWSQLTSYLWKEIGKWSMALDWDKIGRKPFSSHTELKKTELELRWGLAFAASPDKPATIEGLHATAVLILLDEAKIISPDLFNSIEGALSGVGEDSDLEGYVLAISTPGEPAGRFYDIHCRKKGLEAWHVRHVTLEEAIAAKRMTRRWVEDMRLLWGENSALFQNHVMGEFHADDEDAVIPLRWVEAAHERWRQWEEAGKPDTEGMKTVGVDVARSGKDRSVAAIRNGDVITRLESWAKADTMVTTGRVVGIMNTEPGTTAVVDVIGIGAGVYDRLREQGLKADPFHAGMKTGRRDKTHQFGFFDVRSAAWWGLREALEMPGAKLALPPDDALDGDLTALHYKHTSDGKIRVESKDEVRKRIGRSTDHGDAVIQSVWLTSGGWADAYRQTAACDKCERSYRPDLPGGKWRDRCPHCNAPIETEDTGSEAA